MGQQQLILLVLATVIVGIAIVVGITAFTENSARSNADALMQDAVRIGNDIQAWVEKPKQFGGAADGETWKDAEWATIGYATTALTDGGTGYRNLNGQFSLSASGDGALITGQKFDDDSTTVKNEVVVAVCGSGDDDITGAVTRLNSQSVSSSPGC